MLNATSQAKNEDGTITVGSAMQLAWVSWVVMLVLPFFLFLYCVLHVAGAEGPPPANDGQPWFLLSAMYLLAAVPASFFWRSKLFEAYYSGHPVKPQKYLSGMLAVWIALEVGGLFSLTGCILYKSLLPDLIPALVAFMFFVTLWPSGRAMTRRVGQSEDASVYEEPR